MQLLEIRVTGGSNSACKDQFKDYILINTNIQMCAGDIEKNVKDACQVLLVLYTITHKSMTRLCDRLPAEVKELTVICIRS